MPKPSSLSDQPDRLCGLPLAKISLRLAAQMDHLDRGRPGGAARQKRDGGERLAVPRCDAAKKAEMAREGKARNAAGFRPAEDTRYDQRSSAERVNSNLKDNHGGRTVRVRGASKVICHLTFGIVVITALQIVRLVT
jgi:hypothetical protein